MATTYQQHVGADESTDDERSDDESENNRGATDTTGHRSSTNYTPHVVMDETYKSVLEASWNKKTLRDTVAGILFPSTPLVPRNQVNQFFEYAPPNGIVTPCQLVLCKLGITKKEKCNIVAQKNTWDNEIGPKTIEMMRDRRSNATGDIQKAVKGK